MSTEGKLDHQKLIDHFAGIGMAVTAFSYVEVSIDHAIWLFLGVTDTSGFLVTRQMDVSIKLKLLEALVKLYVDDTEERDKFVGAIKLADCCRIRRNKLTHGVWEWFEGTEFQPAIHRRQRGFRPPDDNPEPLSLEKLIQLKEDCFQAEDDIGQLTFLRRRALDTSLGKPARPSDP